MTGSAADAAPAAAAPLPAAGAERAAWLLLALPAAGAVILLLGGRRTDRWGHLVGVLMAVAAFAYAAVVFAQMLGQSQRARELTVFTWIVAAGSRRRCGRSTPGCPTWRPRRCPATRCW